MSIKNFVYRSILYVINRKGIREYIPDSLFLRVKYQYMMKKKLNLDTPSTFTEKLQCLKLKNRNPLYNTFVDKYEVKEHITNIIGKEYIIPTLGVWDSFEEIDFDKLPNQFVLKCTHDSGSVVICRDKNEFSYDNAKEKLNKGLSVGSYWWGREWAYKDLKPRIIAEEYLSSLANGDLRDYKFFCFNGEVKCFKIDFNRFSDHRANYYDRECNLLPFGEVLCPPNFEANIQVPENIEEMIRMAELLSKDSPFLRVDLYDVNGKIFFGELTLYPASGYGSFTDEKWDNLLGDWITLPK